MHFLTKALVLAWFLIYFNSYLGQSAVVPLNLTKTKSATKETFGYIEYKPNGTLILHSALENGTSTQNLLLLRSILAAIKLAPQANPSTKFNFKIYGDGVEHKFPPFLESLIQRIQTYFSVYRYTDTSRPVKLDEFNISTNLIETTTLNRIIEETPVLSTTMLSLEEADSVNEFISIGENDGYITVGED